MGAFSFRGWAMQILPNRALDWPIAWAGVEEVARSEGCRLRAYRDITGVWTIGWGETEGVTEGMVWSRAEADLRLCARLGEFSRGVRARLTRAATANQLAAMVSLAYNIGLAAFGRSSVLAAHNRGDDLAAARAFGLWNKARVDGVLREVRGLTARRAREAALYLAAAPESLPPLDAVPEELAGGVIDMPEPEPESRLAASPIAQGGVASMVTGGLAAASSASGSVREISWGLGVDPLLILAAVAVVAGAVVLFWRNKQRRDGWA